MKENTDLNMTGEWNRTERLPAFLNPDFFKIDDRSASDLLEGTIKLARLINFYDDSNNIDGNWEDFFNSDIDVLVMLLSKLRQKHLVRKFDRIFARLQNAQEPESAVAVWNEAFAFLYPILTALQRYCAKLMLPENMNHRTVGMTSVANSLHDGVRNFISGYHEFKTVFPGIAAIDFKGITGYTGQPAAGTRLFTEGDTAQHSMELALSWFNSLFADIRLKFSNLLAATDYYLQHIKWEGNVYEPHLGLFMTFLQLYQHLQDEINKITGRHLQHYYNHTIGIEYRPVSPEKLYLLFQNIPAKAVVRIPAGELILAEVPGTKQAAEYLLQQDSIITQAEIKELKTGFISRKQQFSSGSDAGIQVEELRMYIADQPVIQPQNYKDQVRNINPWPLLGEEQSELPLSQKTMISADLGLIVSTSLLYAQDGKRAFRVRFYLTPASFLQLQDYISNFSEVTGYSISVLTSTLLSDSLRVQITTANGWYPVKKYNFRLSSLPSDYYLELNFVLETAEPSTAVYNPVVHGGKYNLLKPALWLTLNNDLFHHPFSFFKDFVLERISLRLTVTGSRQLTIRNSLGMVSPADPFQLFGPLPAVGSYADIKNTNVFNRYTRNCSVHIEWFDLPKEPGGFETYFSDYKTGIRNEFYTVSLSALSDGRPVTPLSQQPHFRLFETVRSNTSQLYLKEDTVLKDIDGGRLFFKNDLLMHEEAGKKTDLVKGGSIRIELASPEDPFGHHTYPRILPGIVAGYAKKLKLAFEIPNPPYIPMAKQVTVDYVLEHTEIINSSIGDDDDFTVLHLYPFGYKTAYPGSDTAEVHMIPQIAQDSNLLVGLQSLTPGSEISFLFELEETTYHHTAHFIEPVVWSYLQNNNWIRFRADDILYDNTNHFSNTGIVTIKTGRDIAKGNTIVNPDLYWLKASSSGHRTAGSRVWAIFPGAATAIRNMDSGSGDQTLILPPDSVKGFKQKIPDVAAIWQLFPSRGGNSKETMPEYNLRVSERLRHKDRLLTSPDFGQMVLDAFPQIQLVKCIRREAMKNIIQPGVTMHIIVIPEKRREYMTSGLPRISLSLLVEIKEYISARLSPFAKVEVGNPVYEDIKIVCSVTLKKNGLNANDGYYINQFNTDIRKFITPWLFADSPCIKTGGRIYLSDIQNFIRNCPYIGYVSGFSVIHFYRRYNTTSRTWEAALTDSSRQEEGYIKASRPDAVLVSSDIHMITILDSPAYQPSVSSGIGDLVIGKELYLSGNDAGPAATTEKEVPAPENEDNLSFYF